MKHVYKCPCKGEGAILKYLPSANWCEIQEGRDFFQWTQKADWIMTNPLYSLVKEFLKHSFEIAENVVFLVPLHNFFRSDSFMKVCRDYGWIKHIRTYGNGGKLGFPMGNPVGALYFVRSYVGDTSWSWYAPNTASTRPLVRTAKNRVSKSSASSVKPAGSPSGG